MAVIAGRDPGNDLALLRLENPQLSGEGPAPAEIASEPARVGQLALALGRPSQEGIQASLGIVSALGGPVRTGRGILLEKYIRTDAIPYPGFSGGPLVDAAGRVIGLNTSGLARGAGLTIPIAYAWQVAQALAESGHVRRGYLGVRSQPVELPAAMQEALGWEQGTGLLLVNLEEGSPAAQGGLQVGDILVSLNGERLASPDDLLVLLSGPLAGQEARIEILRGGQPKTLAVTIGERRGPKE
jgi:S1-C subfamily serine protease